MKIYSKLFKSIATKNLAFKNNIDTTENIDLENNVTYFDPNFPRSIPVNVEYSKVVIDLINVMILHPMTP